MYQQAQAEQQANAGQEQAGPQDDNIVDADFTEVNDEKYIFNLLLRIINVSIQTVDIVNSLPKIDFD